jgi:hypothetical protein
MLRHPLCLLLLFSASLCACSGDDAVPRESSVASAPFESVLEPQDTVVLRAGTPIVKFAGLDVDPSGRLAIVDLSEGIVHIFNPDGSYVRSLGRRGTGPGEFMAPHTPRFGPDGRVHVPDSRRGTISVFDSAGTFQREIPTRNFVVVSTFEVLRDGSYLVSGLRRAADENVLFTMDSTGVVGAPMLPIGHRRPADARKSPAWMQIRRPSFTRNGDTTLAVLSVSDSLWSSTRAGLRSEAIPIQGYLSPKLPPGGPMDIRKVREWGRSFSTVADVFSTDSSIAVPVVRGVLYEGDSTIVAFRRPSGRWINLVDSPVLLRAANGFYIGTPDPTADAVTVVRYRRRR